MSLPPNQPTLETLEATIRETLASRLFPPCAIEAWVGCEKRFGFLRPTTRPELIQKAELFWAIPPPDSIPPPPPPEL
jgi:hypothetical protein